MKTILKARIGLTIFLLLIINSIVFAGPFGLEMGMTLSTVRDLTGVEPKKEGPNIYSITPPKPHPAFEAYVVRVNSKNEIYFVKAIGKDIITSIYGTELQSAFRELISSLERTYGKYKLYDYLKNGSIWDEPRDFMMAMIKKERYLMAFWDRDEGSNLPEDILNIAIAVIALSTNKGYLALDYSFINMEEAEKEIKAEEDSVF